MDEKTSALHSLRLILACDDDTTGHGLRFAAYGVMIFILHFGSSSYCPIWCVRDWMAIQIQLALQHR